MRFCSNARAATPTAAAELVTEGASKLNEYFFSLKNALLKEIKSLIQKKMRI